MGPTWQEMGGRGIVMGKEAAWTSWRARRDQATVTGTVDMQCKEGSSRKCKLAPAPAQAVGCRHEGSGWNCRGARGTEGLGEGEGGPEPSYLKSEAL